MSILVNYPAIVALITALSFIVSRRWLQKRTCPGLPPGPKPLPIVGNIRDLPTKGEPEFRHWLAHKDAYGPISSITVMGQTIVIVHDKQIAVQLLEQQSLKTSGRPKLAFADMCGFSETPACRQHDDVFRRCRKLMHQQIGTDAKVTEAHQTIETEGQRFLEWALNKPESLMEHVKTLTGAVMLKATYGYSVDVEHGDPLVRLVERYMANFSKAFSPGTWLVDVFPALKHLPDNLPGMAFKKTARRWKKTTEEGEDIPYFFVRHQMKGGYNRDSFTSRLVQQHGESGPSREDELNIKSSAMAQFTGGSDTTVAALRVFILAMIKFPEIQRKAQQEIDSVIGTDRLPQHKDRVSLPYIEGVVKEVFRWSPVGYLGIPHMATENLVQNDYLIPKGAMIIPNIWWFTHDPKVYSDADSFNPDRYQTPFNEPDPKNVIFGFGRRICPGRYFANASIFIIIAQMLSVFYIRKAVDKHGIELEAQLKVQPGLVSFPLPFPYKITPRDDGKADLIRRMNAEKPREMSDASFFDGVVFGE
ncbi:hypothetical protein XA68_10101 [Ophiocordyceps unilateralis]|uniref:Cytochrome P450 n=1 Tax=Ophiocordyceps unilateralis TaxID=268505 RepID=A0A2A9PRA9_OPHUN|nr:hypothetical protein XA68_10101 [Ophiocordyceps unilateralis]